MTEKLIEFLDKKIDDLRDDLRSDIAELKRHVDDIRMSRAKAAGAMAVISLVVTVSFQLFMAWYSK